MRHHVKVHALITLAGLLVLPVMLSAADPAPTKSWTDKVKFSGDFRYRHELISEEIGIGATKSRVPDRQRQRLRARIGIQGQVNDQITIITRFATSAGANGASDPTSTNQDLGGGFSSKPFWLERAYVDFHPIKQFTARAGKFAVPFDGTELVWDGDLNLEGMAVLPSIKLKSTELYLGVGGFWAVEHKSGDGPEQALFVQQAGATSSFGPVSGLLSLSHIDYGHVKNGPTLVSATKGLGNTVHTIGTSTSTYYNNDFNLVDVTTQLQFKASPADVVLLGDYVLNTGTTKDTANTGWLAGVSLKFKHLPLDWELGYNYRVIEADATIGAYADSDPAGGGTNYDGHKISAFATVLPNTRLGVSYMRDRKDPHHARQNYNRLMVDLETKF